MKKAFLLIFITGFAVIMTAQDYTKMENRANEFFENEEYIMALRLYDSLINKFPENPFYLSRAADCHFKTGNFESAISFYREALEADSRYDDAIFKLASVYDETGVMDSSIHYFRKYINLNPGSPNGYNRLSIVYMSMPGYEDSAIDISKKAIDKDPDNPRSYYLNAMAYLNNSLPVSAISAARKGLRYDTTYALLYMPMGIGYLQRGDYEEAYNYLEKGMAKSNDKEAFVEYASIAKLYLNTGSKNLKHEDNNRVYFSRIHSKNLDKLLKDVRDESSEYYYPELLAKFNDHPLEFRLDEFFMLYLGFTTDKNYSPYFPENEILEELWENEKYNEYINEARIYLLEHPVDFHIYLKMAMISAYQGLEDLHFKNSYRYHGFLKSLMATGNGESTREAIAICFPWHKNSIMSELGYEILDQTIIKEGEEVFERITGMDAMGKNKEVYFNISIPYKQLEKALDPGNNSE